MKLVNAFNAREGFVGINGAIVRLVALAAYSVGLVRDGQAL